MTKLQTNKYWREWQAVRRIQPGADRHELHIRALGFDCSSKRLTNRQFDLILAEFWRITKPNSLTAQMRQQLMSLKRAWWTIRSYPETYVQAICTDKYGTTDLQHLSNDQVFELAMTLKHRSPQPPDIAPAPEIAPDTNDDMDPAPVACLDNCPF